MVRATRVGTRAQELSLLQGTMFRERSQGLAGGAELEGTGGEAGVPSSPSTAPAPDLGSNPRLGVPLPSPTPALSFLGRRMKLGVSTPV